MEYRIFRLSFSTAVHFGGGRLSESENRFHAGRLFSALCIEALKIYGENGIKTLVSAVKNDGLLFSDAFAFSGETFFIPKPFLHIETDRESNSTLKKAYKRLEYISFESLESYVSGENFDVRAEAEKLNNFGKYTQKNSVGISRCDDDSSPYYVGEFRFGEDCGLYFIVGFEDKKALDIITTLVDSLGYSGIGGKLSAGLGKFSAELLELPETASKRFGGEYKTFVSLSDCMPQKGEIDKAIISADYSVRKCGGFIQSDTFARTAVKKRDFYCFRAGSCFENRFSGDVFDVGIDGNHPVYRYAKPMFMGVK